VFSVATTDQAHDNVGHIHALRRGWREQNDRHADRPARARFSDVNLCALMEDCL